jgi:hypothetical protein
MISATLLGPQVRDPNLAAVLRELALAGPFACISAGWQEREGEIDELRTHVAAEVRDLRLYARTEAVFDADGELRAAHRDRQARLQRMQELYGARLLHAKEAARELFERSGDDAELRVARRQAVAALRRLDRAHLAAIRRVHQEFDAHWQTLERPAVRAAIGQVRRDLDGIGALFITGGHVAVLVNRLRLLGGAALLAGTPIVAWSAGAMALSEAVVLFHDQPPQGGANAEVFDAGLGIVRGVIPLPHAQSRLALHDATRVALFARRFAPAACLTLDPGACLHFVAGRLHSGAGSFRLSRRGALDEVA